MNNTDLVTLLNGKDRLQCLQALLIGPLGNPDQGFRHPSAEYRRHRQNRFPGEPLVRHWPKTCFKCRSNWLRFAEPALSTRPQDDCRLPRHKGAGSSTKTESGYSSRAAETVTAAPVALKTCHIGRVFSEQRHRDRDWARILHAIHGQLILPGRRETRMGKPPGTIFGF